MNLKDMIDSLDGLFSLGLILNRTLGPLHRIHSSPSPFTHMIHSRFSSPETLQAHSSHPVHVDVVKDYVLPICDDVLAVDWVVEDLQGPLAPPPGSAMRVSLLKLKEGEAAAKDEVLGVVKESIGSQGNLDGVDQVTFGENISPLRAQGYSIASLVLFHGLSELEAADTNGVEESTFAGEKIKEHLESAIGDTHPSKVKDMIDNLDGLFSLGLVLNRTSGPVHRVPSSPSPFTHMIHSRFSSPETLRAYSAHPDHVAVAKEYVLPICDDAVVVDWVVDDLRGPLAPPPGSAMRVSLLKLKEGEAAVKDEILGEVKESIGSKGNLDGVHQVTFGENISPLRAQGYSIASLVLFHGLSELEAADTNGVEGIFAGEQIKEHLESVIVVDFVVPPQ
ncbi:hypothetical protein Tsubulata_047072 [Turnera subulata]|uniref:Stress-response A/B barrel domain-containing protein n=1 Tax=Turnera subulata TaxID=218843 RepID=A0A9Q0FI32_9ROSI|nr:hypothetical protein Tsubulata_047072 [Turnera subulata]